MPTMPGTQVLWLPPLRCCPAHRHHSATSGPWWNDQGNHFVGDKKCKGRTHPVFRRVLWKRQDARCSSLVMDHIWSYLHLEQKQSWQPWIKSDIVYPGQVTLLSRDSPVKLIKKVPNHDTAQSAFIEETKENDRPARESKNTKNKHQTIEIPWVTPPCDRHGRHGPMTH